MRFTKIYEIIEGKESILCGRDRADVPGMQPADSAHQQGRGLLTEQHSKDPQTVFHQGKGHEAYDDDQG